MKAAWLLACVFLLALPAKAEEGCTVAQLEDLIAKSQKSDKETARQIGRRTLIERLSQARQETLRARLPGEKSREALLVLADSSAFLDLPAADIPTHPPPTGAEQRDMVVRAVRETADTLHKLPNFFATRDTAQFQSKAIAIEQEDDESQPTWKRIVLYEPSGRSQTMVYYRGGQEEIDNQHAKTASPHPGVENRGEFGDILRSVIADLIESQIRWSHWEQGAPGLLAVFRFDVPKERAHYQWTYSGNRTPGGASQTIHDQAAYHAEIAIDPKTGSIYRLAVRTDPNAEKVLQAAEVVEYGPVEIGGNSYICPLRNVVLFVARLDTNEDLEFSHRYRTSPLYTVTVSHTEFRNYHLFRSESRIVSVETDVPADANPEH